jgi:UDP-N-acetylglucosamine acyltransferase
MSIHARCDIHPSATIADNVEIGPGVCIGPASVIGAGADIGPNVVIGPNTTIGEGVRIFTGAVIGTEPQDIKYDGSPTRCTIGPRTVIREYVTINRGTRATGETVVGSDSYLMAYVHVAHDCRVGNHVVMANNAAMAGHCVIEDNSVIGGYSSFHQFVRVGKLAMIGGFSGLRQDAPPFMITFGYPPAKVYGLNTIGLKRSGMSPATREQLKESYRMLFRSGMNFADALEALRGLDNKSSELEHLIKFFETSKRGVCRGASRGQMSEVDPVLQADLDEDRDPQPMSSGKKRGS